MRGESAYAAAKAGVVGLARSVAVDHTADGVTANAVAPGWIGTSSQTHVTGQCLVVDGGNSVAEERA